MSRQKRSKNAEKVTHNKGRLLGSKFRISFFCFFFWGGGGGVQKNEYFWGMKILWIFFWGHHKIWLVLRGHFYAFYGLFLRSRYRMGIFWGVAKISNIFFGCLNSWYILGWTVVAFCGISSRSSLFAKVPVFRYPEWNGLMVYCSLKKINCSVAKPSQLTLTTDVSHV